MTAPAHSDALVFFGATGDLAYKKIIPAVENLVRRGRHSGPVVGVARETGHALPADLEAGHAVGDALLGLGEGAADDRVLDGLRVQRRHLRQCMADRGDPKVQEEAERKRRMRMEQAGGGRDATVMTGPAEPYGSSDLGK